MAKREIKFSLIYRDMFQSSGKYQPRVDQLVRIAPVIIDMGCFSRVETNGGAFEQVQLLYGENPNKAVREWTQPFNDVGIQTHMLERALNGIRMFGVPADVRKLMYKVKGKQGTNIARSFCGLNDHRNLENSVKFAKEGGMISQVALCITYSKIHTVEYYMKLVDQVVEYGADEICLKDMAGIGRPATLGKLVKAIKTKYPKMIVQYHGHSGPGFSVASMLEVAKAGADYVDVAMEPLSWGMVHPDVITIREMLKDAGFLVPDINMNAYMEARALTNEFIDDFLGYWINPKNRFLSSLMVESGLPGGMMGSLMADLKGVHQGINMSLKMSGQPEITEDELLIKLFNETTYVWPKLGYPPLVTPFSQYVKNVALLNIVQLSKGEERYSMMDDNTWNMILGRSGKLPGPLAPEIIKLAEEKGKEFYTGVPQDAYPDELDKYRKEMDENGWDYGEDDEELFEFAMHETQYRDYKSGLAKKRFEDDLEKMRSQDVSSDSKPKTTVAVKEKQAPNRKSYNTKEVEQPIALIAYALYSTNPDREEGSCCHKHDIWSDIGYWRNGTPLSISSQDHDYEMVLNPKTDKAYDVELLDDIYQAKLLFVDTAEVDVEINGESYYAKIAKGDEDFFKVTINEKDFQLKRNDVLEMDADLGDEDAAIDEEHSIISPIPGRVFKINVEEGDEVKKGDVVIIVEAMKMENNIAVKRDAVIKSIKAELDAMVEAGEVLIEIE